MKNQLTFFLLLITSVLLAQDNLSTRVTSNYSTASITPMMVKFSKYDDQEWAFEEGFYDIDLSTKYFNNPASIEIITSTGKKGYIASFAEEIKTYTEREDKFAKRMLKGVTDGVASAILGEKALLNPTDSLGLAFGKILQDENGVANDILKKWAVKDKDGNFTVLNQRSQSSLNTVDLRNQVDYQKLDAFKDLFYKNYIMLFDFGDIISAERYAEDYPMNAGVNVNLADYVVEINTYVYKLDVDDILFEQIKNKFGSGNFSSLDIPIKYVGRYLSVAESSFTNDTKKSQETPQQRKDRKTRTYKELAQKAYDEIIELAEMRIEDFKLRTKVTSGFPSKIRAEIGMNENVKLDQRYFAYENVERSTGEIESKLVGVIRVAEIVDNVSSKTDDNNRYKDTRFNQVWGNPVKEGMFLVQESDFGVGISAGLRTMRAANFNFRVEYRISDWIKKAWKNSPLVSTNIYGDIFFVNAAVEGSNAEIQLSTGIGVSSKFYVNKWIKPEPYFGYYLGDGFTFINLGVRFDYPLKHNLFIVPELGLSTAKRKNDNYLPVVFGASIKYEL